MPEVRIAIGGREFEVACQPGEEHYLRSAAALLDAEASALNSQIGRMPEARMLLMAGLMLADKTAGLEEQLRALDGKLGAQEALIEELRSRPEASAEPQVVEVHVVPPGLRERLDVLAAQAEAVAARVEAGAA